MSAVVGTELPERTFRITRAGLVRYAAASGDFNPIHQSEQAAVEAGLPGVIAHGMYTMALAGRVVTDWLGDPGAVTDYRTRFVRPIPVPDGADGVELQVSGVLKRVLEDGQLEFELNATSGGQRVLAQAKITARPRA